MRLLEEAGIAFEVHRYDPALTDGGSIARVLGTDPDATCKTLVTTGGDKKYFVFVLPVDRELDLKACARLAGVKSVEMLPQKELFPLTGYVHGGCSPLGMRKRFPTYFESLVAGLPLITLSAGKTGRQVTVSPKELMGLCDASSGSFSRPKSGD